MFTKYLVLVIATIALIAGLALAGINIILAIVITGSVNLIAIATSDLVASGQAKEAAEPKKS